MQTPTEQTPVKKSPTIRLNPQPIKVGPFTIPPLNIRTAVLLERIESPFVVPQFDPATGAPIAKPPTITDVTRALFVFVNADAGNIEELADDPKAFDSAMMEMARQIDFKDLGAIAKAIRSSVEAVNVAAEAAGLEPSGNGPAIGGPNS